jgi:hypothetical protein
VLVAACWCLVLVAACWCLVLLLVLVVAVIGCFPRRTFAFPWRASVFKGC